MNWLRQRSALAVFVILALTAVALGAIPTQPASAAATGQPAEEKWGVDRALELTPQPEPKPALGYRLFPLASDRKPGNAVPIYLRLAHERNDASRRILAETPRKWNKLPIDQIPLDEARKFLKSWHTVLRQLELGATRKQAEWNYTFDQGSVIDILLPDAQTMRRYVPILILKARVELAEGNFAGAAHWLQTGLAFSQHAGSGPFLINRLVGIACANQCLECVLDFMERPGAPNLYWSLTALPTPLIDLGTALDFEYRVLEMEFSDLADLDRPRSAGEWDRVLRKVRTEFQRLAGLDKSLKAMEGNGAADPAARSPDLPAAKKHLVETRKLSKAKVEAMPPAQVLLLHLVDTYSEFRDDFFKTANLPYQEARRRFARAEDRLKAAPLSEAKQFAQLLPAIMKVRSAEMRLGRNIAVLRVIEALRMHTAAHKGRLPDKLSEVTIVPVPDDPCTGRPFVYERAGNSATLISRFPGEKLDAAGVRYRLAIRNK